MIAERVRMQVTGGIVEGVALGAVHRYLSIPYAAPVTDARRFEPPQPVEPWQGVRDATRAGASAPQALRALLDIDMTPLVHASETLGPDYLTLNIWAPADASEPRPVMVFIHGGSFAAGSKDATAYDGAQFARDGIVLVSINYRMGILGFLPIPGAPTNLGLRDAIAALGWVRDNIASFGGSPSNVTVFGESAGACCAELVALSPLAKGLMRRAICQSGQALLSRDIATMQPIVRRIARRLGVKADKRGFAAVSTERLLKAQQWIAGAVFGIDLRDRHGIDLTFGASRFLPVYGDDVAPKTDVDALIDGAGADIDMLIGANTEEFNLFFAPGDAGAKLRRWHLRLAIRRGTPRSDELLRAYGLDDKNQSAGAVMSRLMTDIFFRAPARRVAALHRGNTWVYEFDWRSPACAGKLGAAHAVELPFVFDTLAAASGSNGIVGDNPPQELADRVHALWVGFAAHGSLPWEQYREDRPIVYSIEHGESGSQAPIPAAAFLPPASAEIVGCRTGL